MDVEETVVKQEEITEEKLMEQDPLEVQDLEEGDCYLEPKIEINEDIYV